MGVRSLLAIVGVHYVFLRRRTVSVAVRSRFISAQVHGEALQLRCRAPLSVARIARPKLPLQLLDFRRHGRVAARPLPDERPAGTVFAKETDDVFLTRPPGFLRPLAFGRLDADQDGCRLGRTKFAANLECLVER